MKRCAAVAALILPILMGCQSAPELRPLRHESPEAKEVVIEGVTIPPIWHVIQTSRDEVLASADIVFFWSGSSKFGSLYFKHRDKWYAAGGFIGNVSEFIHDEAKLSGGTLVYVTDSRTPFDQTRYGSAISVSIARGTKRKWAFYYLEADAFGAPPTARDYFDVHDKKIVYADY